MGLQTEAKPQASLQSRRKTLEAVGGFPRLFVREGALIPKYLLSPDGAEELSSSPRGFSGWSKNLIVTRQINRRKIPKFHFIHTGKA